MSAEAVHSPQIDMLPVASGLIWPSFLRRPNRFIAACVAAAAFVGLSAAGTGRVAGREYDLPGYGAAYDPLDLPVGSCAPSTPKAVCSEAITSGRTALVTYGISLKDAANIAEAMEQQMPEVTGGLMGGTVTAIEASAQARQRFDQADCVTIQDLRTYGSIIAEQTMPELSAYDYVLGLSPKADCDMTAMTLGSAAIARRRDADLLIGGIWDTTLGSGNIDSLEKAVDTAIHEKAHLDTLGHHGAIIPKGYASDAEIDAAQAAIAPGVFDATAHARQNLYDAYNGDDVMSSIDDADNVSLNAVQRSYLRALVEQAPAGQRPGVSDARKGPLSFSPQQAADGAYATILLTHPITYAEGMDQEITFDTLAVVPQASAVGEQDGPLVLDTVTLYLAARGHNDVASFGPVFQAGPGRQDWTLKVDDETFAVQLDEKALRIVPPPAS